MDTTMTDKSTDLKVLQSVSAWSILFFLILKVYEIIQVCHETGSPSSHAASFGKVFAIQQLYELSTDHY